MKISTWLNLILMSIIGIFTLATMFSGIWVIGDLCRNFQSKIMTLELEKADMTIFDVLNRSGLQAAVKTAGQIQRENRNKSGFMAHTRLVILEPPGRILYHPEHAIGKDAGWLPLAPMKAGKEGFIQFDHKGKPYYAVYRTISPLNWLLVMTITGEAMFERARTYALIICGLALAVAAASGLLINRVVRKLVGRIRATLACVTRIEVGDLSARVRPVAGTDEIGRLQKGINDMVGKLEGSMDEIRHSQEFLNRVIRASTDAPWEWDLEKNHIYYSPQWFAQIGFQPGDLPGDTELWKTRLHPDDRDRVNKEISDAFDGKEEIHHLEFRLRHRDGHYVQVLSRALISRTDRGRPVRVTGTNMDLTEQKALEKEISRKNTLLEATIIQSPIPITLVSMPDNTLLYINPAAAEVEDQDPDILRGGDILEIHRPVILYHPDGRRIDPSETPAARALMHQHKTRDMELVLERHDGSKRRILSTALPIYDAEGVPIAMLNMFPDITGRKLMEEKLRQAQKMEAIGHLAGGIAHDFNNLLFPITGHSEMLMDSLPPDSGEIEDVKEIYKAALRATGLVRQILDFSRQSSRELMPLNLHRVLKEVMKLCRATVPADIDMEWHLPKDCGRVMADPVQIHQVAMNLITNAYQAIENSDKTGGRISMTLARNRLDGNIGRNSYPPAGDYARITVSDNGQGIDEAHLNQIFEPYFTTKPKGKGTGLGLATVYGIIKAHQGDIRVRSRQGQGTTFVIHLPLVRDTGEETDQARPDVPVYGSGRILFVDDETYVTEMAKNLLPMLGYRVTVMNSSVEALELFRADPRAFDLVITDMTMPVMTGDRLAGELMAIRPGIPVIMCTGFSERINAQKAAAIGIREFLLKPVTRGRLSRAIQEVLPTAAP